MKSKIRIFMFLVVPCGLAATYLANRTVAGRPTRIENADIELLGLWLRNVLYDYTELQGLSDRAAVREWAKGVANQGGGFALPINASNCPVGLTPMQANAILHFTMAGLFVGCHKATWDGWFTLYRTPSECLERSFLDQYQCSTGIDWWSTFSTKPNPAVIGNNREGFERIANNRELVSLIDECWMIGYRRASPLPFGLETIRMWSPFILFIETAAIIMVLVFVAVFLRRRIRSWILCRMNSKP